MTDDNLDSVYLVAEKAFIRMQANEVLTRCLDLASLAPVHKLVESLILAGPESLEVLREILAETNTRKSQVEEDLAQVMHGLRSNLAGYGVDLGRVRKPAGVTRIRPEKFLHVLVNQGVADGENQVVCMQLFQDARDILVSLTTNYSLLGEVEKYLRDWLWGVYYNSVREEQIL